MDKHDIYLKKIFKKFPHIRVLQKYENSSTKILHNDIRCSHNDWMVTPNKILMGRGCPDCAKENRRKKLSKKHNEYIKEVKEKYPHIEVLEEYKKYQSKISHDDIRCEHQPWLAQPQIILNGYGCPDCANENRRKKLSKKHNEYIKEVKEKYPHIEVLEEYKNNNTPILHNDKRCTHKSWLISPSSILIGRSCPICANNIKKTHDDYIKQVKEKYPHIEVLSGYKNSKIKILFNDNRCLHNNWYSLPPNILNGSGCPFCNNSKGEQDIMLFLNKENIKYISQKKFKECKYKKPLPFDFYLPDYNTCIEYDGDQHFKPMDIWGGVNEFKKRQLRDNIKNDFCIKNNINLIRIKYDENIYDKLKFLK